MLSCVRETTRSKVSKMFSSITLAEEVAQKLRVPVYYSNSGSVEEEGQSASAMARWESVIHRRHICLWIGHRPSHGPVGGPCRCAVECYRLCPGGWTTWTGRTFAARDNTVDFKDPLSPLNWRWYRSSKLATVAHQEMPWSRKDCCWSAITRSNLFAKRTLLHTESVSDS